MKPSLGRHVIAEFWGGVGLSDPSHLENALRQAATSAGATILSSHVHHFGEELGVTGVVILAESHISIHTWPEHAYSAIDAFMCGKADPRVAIEALEQIVRPRKVSVVEHQRGQFAMSELEGHRSV